MKGWKGYRAGLDVNDGQTGKNSFYTKWQGYEIMFHVSALLPFHPGDRQQLERKRHIGNDIVVLIFQESEQQFKLSSISSKQNHVFCFVRPCGNGYEMEVATKTGVPSFTPELPEPCILDRRPVSRDFLLHKCKYILLLPNIFY